MILELLSRRYWLVVASVSLFGAAMLYALGQPLLSSFLALILFGLCLWPTVRHAAKTERGFPTIAVVAMAFGLQYALPVVFTDRLIDIVPLPAEIDEESLVAALVMAIGGMAVFVGVTHARPVIAGINALPALHLQLDRFKALIFCVVVGAIAILCSTAFSIIPSDQHTTYGALLNVLRNQLLVVIGILAWLAFTGNALWLRIAFFAVNAVAVIVGISSGMLEFVVAPLVVALFLHWHYTRQVSKTLVLLVTCLVLFLNPVKSEFREAVLQSPNVSGMQKVTMWVEAATGYWLGSAGGERPGQSTEGPGRFFKRLDMIDLLAHVYDSTPERTPFLYGQTYSFFVYTLIPRFLWPEKPVNDNATLAIKYWLTTPEGAERSSFAVGLLGEAYANFGIVGIVAIMAFAAMMLLLIQRLFGTEASGAGGAAILLAFIVFFINGIGSNAAYLFGNVVQSMLLSWLLLSWARLGQDAGLPTGS